MVMPKGGVMYKDQAHKWAKFYNQGHSLSATSRHFNVNSCSIKRQLERIGVRIKPKSEVVKNENNSQWASDKVGRGGLHAWVRKRLIQPEFCQICEFKPPFDLANISPVYNTTTYNRDLKNWNWLCRSCHIRQDGRIKNLRNQGEVK